MSLPHGRLFSLPWASLLVACFLAVGLVSGCGGKKEDPQREPVELELVFFADKDMNPNLKGRPSPVAVKVFELAGTGAFEEVDYFSLQTDAKGVLAEDFLGVSSFVIRPGARKELRKPAAKGITALGIIAGFRDMDNAIWQIVHPVPLPPETGWFSSPLKVQLHIQLIESEMRVLPQESQ